VDLLFTSAGFDITGLADGGLAGVGDFNATQSNATFFDGDLAVTGTSTLIGGLNGSMDQLTNGNVVTALEDAGDVVYQITTATGATVLADTSVFEEDTTAPDVAALAGGGFVIATTDAASGPNNNIEVRRFDAAGASLGGLVVDGTSANDQGGVVTGLADGGFAVAWTRTAAGPQTEAWIAVYEADGTVRKAPTLLDTGGTTNANMSIVALNTGGFGVAYQDSGWSGTDTEITFARLDAAGSALGFARVTNYADADTDPSLAVLSNGLVAVSYTTLVAGDTDVHLQLINPANGARLLEFAHIVDGTTAFEEESSAAEWGLAGLAVALEGSSSDVDVLQLVRTSTGDGADDLITGDEARDFMDGGIGEDTLSGLANDDRLVGGSGLDQLFGGDGDDSLSGGDNGDNLQGGDGDDSLDGGDAGDTLNGGAGVDTVDYSQATAVTVDLGLTGFQNTGGGGIDRLAGIEWVIGTDGTDSLTGNGADNVLDGGGFGDTLAGAGGDDTLFASHGADSVQGGAGDDYVYGGIGADVMSGGSGSDTLAYLEGIFASSETFLDLGDTTAQNTHSHGADTLIGFENVLTDIFSDRILGTGADNRFESSGGHDTLKSKDGSDVLLAGEGDDKINAGGGDDLVTGGLGEDFIRGGLGADDFIYEDLADSGLGVALADTIRDFRTADGDRIDLSAVYVGNLSYIGEAAFTGGGAEVRVGVVAQGQLVRIDIDGDEISDMDILVANSGLSGGAGDFVL
jgi:hypothetical protein